jgi:hypothetical protein
VNYPPPIYDYITIFKTGFETGDLSEVQTIITDPATIEVNTENPKNGLYSAKIFTDAPGGAYGRGRLYKRPDDLTEIYISADFYIQEWEGYIQCLRIAGHTETYYYTYIATVIISEDYIRLSLGMEGKNEGDWMPIPEPIGLSYYPGLSTGQWYNIRLGFKKDINGFAKVWLNGNLVLSYEGDTSTLKAPGVSRAMCGVVLYQQNRSGPAVLYVDNFMIEVLK